MLKVHCVWNSSGMRIVVPWRRRYYQAQLSQVSDHGSLQPKAFEHHCKNVQTRNRSHPIILLVPASLALRLSHPDLGCSLRKHHAPYWALRDRRINWEDGRRSSNSKHFIAKNWSRDERFRP